MTPPPPSSTVSFADRVLFEWFCPPSRKSFLLHRCSRCYRYPFLVPAFHCLFVLCLFLDHFLFRGGQCCLYVCLLHSSSGPVRGILMGCAPSLLFCHLKAHPTLSTKCWSRAEEQGGSEHCREGVGWRKIFPMTDSHLTLWLCLQQEKIYEDNSSLSVRSNHLGKRQ